MSSERIGTVKRIIFSGDNGYKIMLVKFEDTDKTESTVGYLNVRVAGNYIFTGEETTHAKYGKQFVVTSFKEVEIKGETKIVSFLSSEHFTGIGKGTATKIYEAFGDEAIEIIKTNPERLTDLNLRDDVIEELTTKLIEEESISELYQLLAPLKFSKYLIEEIYKYLSIKKINQKSKYLLANPYQLISEINGYTFASADLIYLQNDGDEHSEVRILYAIRFIVSEFCFQTGDTIISFEDIFNRIRRIIELQPIDLESFLDTLIRNHELMKVNEFYILAEYYEAEQSVANDLLMRLDQSLDSISAKEIENEINVLEITDKMTYTQTQKSAIKNALANQVLLITGGPGTGKTTIIKAICRCYEHLFIAEKSGNRIEDQIMLCAPTGRAAQRMKEATGYPAKTIHSLLEWDPYNNKFNRDMYEPLRQKIFIIDEFSMVDAHLANSLFSAILFDAKIVIVGDPAQLESVNPGNVLHDLISSSKFPIVNLDAVFRQGDGSTIASLAKQINENKPIELIKSHDLSVIEREENIVETVAAIVRKAGENGYDETDVQVLYPKYAGKCGIDNLNEVLRPKTEELAIDVFGKKFRLNDKVMQQKNNYEKDIYNGDIGFIRKIYSTNPQKGEIAMQIEFKEKVVDIKTEELIDLALAYAISIHKSQGSEFKVVIMPLSSEATYMLSKKLIYTGITRARDKLILVGEIDYFFKGIQEEKKPRQTALQFFLKDQVKNQEITPFDYL